MNTLIHLEEWIKNADTNSVDIYVSKHIGQNNSHVIDVSVDPETKGLLVKFGNGSFTKYKNYYHKDYMYSYDLSTDAQRIVKHTHILDTNPHARIYTVSYNENVLASHRFPTTDEMINTNILERTTYRINNRLFLYNDRVYNETTDPEVYHEYVYLHYNHSPQVDIKHIQLDIERVVRQLITPPSKSDPYQ